MAARRKGERPSAARGTATRRFTDRVRSMRRQGMPVREIALRTGRGKSFVNNIITGKQRPREMTAAAGLQHLNTFEAALEQPRLMPIAGGRSQRIEALTKTGRGKAEIYSYYVERAKATGDWDLVRRNLGRRALEIKIAGKGGKAKTVVLEAARKG
jgi:hypothetical protein